MGKEPLSDDIIALVWHMERDEMPRKPRFCVPNAMGQQDEFLVHHKLYEALGRNDKASAPNVGGVVHALQPDNHGCPPRLIFPSIIS